MKQYEMLIVLPGTLSEDEVAPALNMVKKTLESHDAQDISTEDMGKSRLAYPIKHIRYGYFHAFRFACDPSRLATMEKSVRLLGNLLRVIVRIYDPAHTVTVTLAQDPTALSAPSKQEDKPQHREKTNRKEDVKKTESESSAVEQADGEEEKTEDVKEEVKEKSVEKPVLEKAEISMEDIEKKLNEVLQQDIDKV